MPSFGMDITKRLHMHKKSVPLMYDLLLDHPMSLPCPTVEWLPHTYSIKDRQLLLLGTQTGGLEPNMLKVMEVQLSNPFDTEAGGEQDGQQQGMDVDGDGDMEEQPSPSSSQHPLPSQSARKLRTFCFKHPLNADMDRIRHMPQMPHLVATKCADQGLYLFDISPALGGATSQQPLGLSTQQQHDGGVQGDGLPILTESSHSIEYLCGGPLGSLGQQHAQGSSKRKASSNSSNPAPSGYGLCWSPCEAGWLLSTCARGAIAHVRLDTSSPLPTAGGDPMPHGLPALGNVRYQRDAHAGGVNDVAFPASQQGAPASSLSPSNFVSVGEDGYLKLWDERSPSTSICVHAHSGPANSVACSANHVIATGGADGMVRLFDLRAMSAALATLPQASSLAGNSSNGKNDEATHAQASTSVGNRDKNMNAQASTSNGSPGAPQPPPSSTPRPAPAAQGPYQGFPPLAVFRSHHCSVNQVLWSPDWPQLLASVDDDNRVFLWDVSRTEASPSDFTTPPQLRFIHAGQVGTIYDISWSSTPASVDHQLCTPVLASVSFAAYQEPRATRGGEDEEGDSGGGDEERDEEEKVLQHHTLQVFTPDADVLRLGVIR